MKKIFFLALAFCSVYGCKPANTVKKTDTTIPVGLSVGNRAPELAFSSPDGKTIALSSLRGKIVLIDFWASWCPPCRRENPGVVAIYQHFKDKKFTKGNGFTVYSVSCDKDRDAWINAIKTDNLMWENQVSDLKGWESEAATIYKINEIPSNFLIDGDGIILAQNIRGQQFSLYLESLLEK
jgi:thiol-disulfide isomerase/thioredoxin